ncbi:MAG: glutaredoxin domain-containing protein [Desulfopila sp.]
MTYTIYSATGCARCKITKNYMQENGIDFEEFDIKAEGKDAFAQFYREHRKDIFRDKDGVEFPVLTDGAIIRQGVSVIIGYLLAGDKLQGYIGRSELHGEWLSGITVSGGESAHVAELMAVLGHLKANNLKIQAVTSGKNSNVLAALLDKGLLDRLIVEVKGPAELYEKIDGTTVGEEDLRQSVKLAVTAPECSFFTTIAPVRRSATEIAYLSPEEVAAVAQLIAEATGSKKNSYTLCPFVPQENENAELRGLEKLPSSALFKYRTAARRYQVLTELKK